MKSKLSSCFNCFMVILAIVIISSLTYSITLVIEQQKNLAALGVVADRIMVNINKLADEQDRLEKENMELRKLEKKKP